MRYSVVVPIYNDGALARDMCLELAKTFRAHLGHDDLARDLEVVFIDDGSGEESQRHLKATCDEFAFAKAMFLSRNFGQHIAISAGYRAVSGDSVAMLNVDQEDPPHQLPVLFDELERGNFDIVGGLYGKRRIKWSARMTSYLFHATMTKLTGYDTPANASTMRVMTRSAVDVYNRLSERSRYLPGLEMWLGLRYGWLPVEHQPRRAGKSSYNFRRRLRLAIASIISFSDYPLRLAVKFGFAMVTLGMLLGLFLIADKLFLRDIAPGYTSTLAAIVFLGGLQMMVTGVASLYIGRVLAEVQQRPMFVVRETYGGGLHPFTEPVLRANEEPPAAGAIKHVRRG